MSDSIVYSREKTDKLFKGCLTIKNLLTGGVRVFMSVEELEKSGIDLDTLRRSRQYIITVGPPPEPTVTYGEK